jgi:hypothetical protein
MPAAVPTEQVFALGQARVYTSETLTTGSNWVERPYLYCDSWRDVAGPDIGGGTLRYDYGEFTTREADLFTGDRGSGIYQPLSVTRHYVKIEILNAEDVEEISNPVPDFEPEIEPEKTYYGRIDAVENHSAVKDTGSTKTGTQIFTAYDLKVELADVTLRETVIALTEEETVTIGQALGFNVSPVGVRQRHGNETLDSEEFVFAWLPSPDDLSEGEYVEPTQWRADEAVKYLLENDIPKDKDGDSPVTWTLENGDALKWYDIAVQREGRTSLDVLNELIDRRRLVGYTLDCAEDEESDKFTITVKVFTFTEEEIDMPGSNDLPANADVTTLVAQTSPVTESIVLGEIATHVADIVRVEGDPITVTLTLKFDRDEGTKQIVEGWKSELEDAYKEAAGGTEEENTIFRLKDEYEDVYSRFVLSDQWNQRVIRTSDSDEFHAVIPVEDLPDEIDDTEVEELFEKTDESKGGHYWHRGHRFLPFLAIFDDSTKQYRHPLALLKDATRYHYAEKLNATDVYSFACHVYVLPDRPGVRLRVTRHGGQQLIAKSHWDGAADTPSEIDPDETESINYETLLLTVTMEWDDRCYAEEVIDDTRATLKTQLIRVQQARLDIELPGCVTDLDDDGQLVESEGRIIRDNRDRLRDIARAAKAWYGSVRRAARLTYNDTVPIVNVGQFITDLVIGATTEEINTPVTGVAYDFLGGRCYVETSYADADFSDRIEVSGKQI